jgi:hypothetical protein
MDLNWTNYVNIWAVIKRISIAEAEADVECKLAYDIQFPPVVVSEAVVEPPKKRAYKRKPKVVLSVAENVAEEPTVECVAEECVAEECVAVEPVKYPKKRVTRKVLKV